MTLLLAVMTVRVSLVLLCALAAVQVTRRQSASIRHAVLAAGVCGALLVMPLSLVVPTWTLPFMRTVPPGPATAARIDTPAADTSTVSETMTFSAIGVGPATASSAPGPRVSPADVVLIVWAIGAVSLAVLMLGGMRRLRHLRASGRLVTEGPWHEWLQQRAEDMPLLRRVELRQCDTSMLATFGTVSPVILLPADAGRWDRQRIAIVMEHETAHIAGRHALLQLAGQCLSAVFWFNPIVWTTSSRLRIESECVCDDQVLRSGVSADDYATELVALARSLSARRVWLPAPAMARPSSLERRVTAMLDPSLRRTPVTRMVQRAVVAVSLAVTASIAGLAAQDTFARLSGTLHDQLGGTLPGATIGLTHQQSGTKYEVKTNAGGSYDLVGLQAGSYTMAVSAPGFKTSEQALQLSAGQVLRRDATLALGTLQETITIVDGPPPSSNIGRRASSPAPDAASCTAQPNSGALKPPRKVRDVRPVYPQAMRGTSTQGKVELRAVIDVNGAVRTTETISATNTDFEESAAAAVREWRFTPTLLNCVPVEVNMTVSLAFRPAPPPPSAPPAPPVPPAAAAASAVPRPAAVPAPAARPVPPVPPVPPAIR